MLFTGPVSDNPEIKKQYNPEKNAGEQGPVMQKTTTMQKEKKNCGHTKQQQKLHNQFTEQYFPLPLQLFVKQMPTTKINFTKSLNVKVHGSEDQHVKLHQNLDSQS